jgi:putative AdoMet-dependent methyltransferase
VYAKRQGYAQNIEIHSGLFVKRVKQIISWATGSLMLDDNEFDKWAGRYDKSLTPYLDRFPFKGYYDVLAAVRNLTRPVKGQRILDVGVGTGLLSEELYKNGCFIFGVDFSSEMLNKARLRMPGAEFCRVDASQDQFGEFNSRRFERIVSTYFFHHLNFQQQVSLLQRAAQSNLTHDGMIIIGDIGFETIKDYNVAREKYLSSWDDDECYLCGEVIVSRLKSLGIVMEYKQISLCAGILVYQAVK